MRKKSKSDKVRILILFIICCSLGIYTLTKTYSYWLKIVNNYKSQQMLENKYEELLSTESLLQEEIAKLEDPDYVARYAREKYLYSKEGEIIFRIIK